MSIYIVAPTGSDTANGTSAPFKTIQKGASALKAGDKLYIRPGTYQGFVLGNPNEAPIYAAIHGTKDAPILITQEPGTTGVAQITGNSNKDIDGITLMGGTEWVTIQGLNVKNVNYKIGRDCIRVVECKNITLLNNDVSASVRFGISCTNTDGFIVDGNNVHDNPGKGDSFTGHGIYIAQNALNTIVRKNLIRKNGYQGLHLNSDAENGGTTLLSLLVENNVFDSNTGNSINADGIKNTLIQYNVIVGHTKTGISIYAIDALTIGKSSGVVIKNNTIWSPNSSGSSIQLANGSKADVINNILGKGAEGYITLLDSSAVNETANLKTTDGSIFTSATDFHLNNQAEFGAYATGTPTSPPPPPPVTSDCTQLQADYAALLAQYNSLTDDRNDLLMRFTKLTNDYTVIKSKNDANVTTLNNLKTSLPAFWNVYSNQCMSMIDSVISRIQA